ncbi:LytR/AlgR family response regulator transcription factor [Flavobacteriaceae bacterium M23B6Z8]
MRISCAIIEDEPLASERLQRYIEKVSYLELMGVFYSALDALEFLKNEPVDLLFLDVEMDELNGMEFLESLLMKPYVILTTAYEKYALKGYELRVADYLLKPFSFGRFLKAVDAVSKNFEKEMKMKEPFIFLKSANKIERIVLDDIYFIEGMRDYRNVQTTSRKILVLQTFKELEELLPENSFCRVHKSYIVAINRIDFVERNSIQIGKKRIPISETYKKQFFDIIGH